MLTAFAEAAMHEATYKMLEDGTFFGEIPSCPGVWANEKTLEMELPQFTGHFHAWSLSCFR
ncbi:MAG TPA: type II toxin-antitoxin system HicB family antitoxin, partial [Thermosynergistes sp.]|nr:type II toxin-antitoxin system HicB family antitoxin [Thermosynergistes sp.]